MALEDVIDNWIATGGVGSFPSLQVVRRAFGTLLNGTYTRAAPTFFRIAASVRPPDGDEMIDEQGGRYQQATDILYTKSADVFVVQGKGPGGAHESDEFTIDGVAAVATLATPHVDGTYASRVLGDFGNAVTLSLIPGSVLDAGSLDESAWPAVAYYFKSGTTTVGQLEDALAAGDTLDVLATASDLSAVLDGGDAIADVAFAGGGGETWRAIRGARYRRHWKIWIQRIDKP